MEKKYKILEHPADLKIKVFGDTRQQLFRNAVQAMFEAAGYQGNGKIRTREIKVESDNLELLLIDFLSEALYLSEVNQEVYDNVDFEQFSDNKLSGTLTGKKLKRTKTIIKGVTYHNLKITKENNHWQAIVLFDI